MSSTVANSKSFLFSVFSYLCFTVLQHCLRYCAINMQSGRHCHLHMMEIGKILFKEKRKMSSLNGAIKQDTEITRLICCNNVNNSSNITKLLVFLCFV